LRIGSWNNRYGVIGVDLGSHSLKLLQIAPGGTALRAVAAARYPLPADMPRQGEAYHEALGELLRTARREGQFVGRRVVTSLPTEAVTYKNMRFPSMPEAELAQAVQWEAPQRLSDGQTPMTIQHLDAGQVFQGEERRRELVVMGADTSFLEAHLQTLRGAGLKPVAVEAAPVALARSLGLSEALGEGEGARVVVDVGHRSSKVLITRRGEVRFFKVIGIGGAHFDEAVAKHLNMEDAEAAELRRSMPYPLPSDGESSRMHRPVYEALRPVVEELARELGLCLRYYSVTFRGERPEQVALVGGEARQAWLAPLLADTAGVDVTTVDPIDEVGHGDVSTLSDAGPHVEWAVAAGLSLRGQSQRHTTRRAAGTRSSSFASNTSVASSGRGAGAGR
jgi:type IV pilus assembly protein PilM